MTGPDHYAEAQKRMDASDYQRQDPGTEAVPCAIHEALMAIAHATLALAAATIDATAKTVDVCNEAEWMRATS